MTILLKIPFGLDDLHHELRTPLTGILGATNLLQNYKLSKNERDEFVKMILKSAQRLLDINNRILNSPTESIQICKHNLCAENTENVVLAVIDSSITKKTKFAI